MAGRVGCKVVVGEPGCEREAGYQKSSSRGTQNQSNQLQNEVAILNRTLSAEKVLFQNHQQSSQPLLIRAMSDSHQ